jgi:hypothetical protein
MIPVIPWQVAVIVFTSDLIAGLGTWLILSSAATRSGLTAAAQRSVRVGTGVFVGGWFLAVLLLAPPAASVLVQDPFRVTPLIPLFSVLSVSIVLLAIWSSSSFRRALQAASLPALVGIQVYRAVGVVFLILLAQGQVPAHFALPAGWGDVVVGLTAPWVALALTRKARGARALGLTWNAVGLLDLAVAVGMGTGWLAPLLVPGLGSRVPSVTAMGAYPMILIPTFTVPLSVMLHVLAVRGLLREIRFGPLPAVRRVAG